MVEREDTVDRVLEGDFPWGLLLITDDLSTEQIPSWPSPDSVVARGRTAIVIKVRHPVDGQASIFVGATVGDVAGEMVFDGSLEIASGTLRVGSADGSFELKIPVAAGLLPIRVFCEPVVHATRVDIVLPRSNSA